MRGFAASVLCFVLVVSLLGVSFWLVFEGTEKETKKHVVSPVSRHIYLQPETL